MSEHNLTGFEYLTQKFDYLIIIFNIMINHF